MTDLSERDREFYGTATGAILQVWALRNVLFEKGIVTRSEYEHEVELLRKWLDEGKAKANA